MRLSIPNATRAIEPAVIPAPSAIANFKQVPGVTAPGEQASPPLETQALL
jgi:hypothetical protein